MLPAGNSQLALSDGGSHECAAPNGAHPSGLHESETTMTAHEPPSDPTGPAGEFGQSREPLAWHQAAAGGPPSPGSADSGSTASGSMASGSAEHGWGSYGPYGSHPYGTGGAPSNSFGSPYYAWPSGSSPFGAPYQAPTPSRRSRRLPAALAGALAGIVTVAAVALHAGVADKLPGFGSNGSSASGTAASSSSTDYDRGVVNINAVLGGHNANAAGTGMILDADGTVLTNNHVVQDATSITATDVNTGKRYSAAVV